MRDFSPCFQAIHSLDRLPPTLFERLLEGHSAALTGAGIDHHAILDARALWEVRERLPFDLVDAIHRVHDMSDDIGHDHLLYASGGPLFVAESGAMPAVTLAVQTLLNQPAVFDRVHGQRCVEPLRRFREFPGRHVVLPHPSLERLARTEGRFAAAFQRRERTDYCRITRWEEPHSLHYMITHGRCRRMDPALVEHVDGCRESFVSWRPRQHDLVTFDTRTGRLRVSANDARAMAEYVEGFGEALFDDASWFDEGTIVSLDPLLLGRDEALRPTRGLLGVKLVELEVGMRLGGNTTVVVRGDDVFSALDDMAVDPAAWGTLRGAKLRVQFRSNRAWRTVSLSVPDRVSGDWRRDNAAVRGFLEERGFLAGPPGEPQCLAA